MGTSCMVTTSRSWHVTMHLVEITWASQFIRLEKRALLALPTCPSAKMASVVLKAFVGLNLTSFYILQTSDLTCRME